LSEGRFALASLSRAGQALDLEKKLKNSVSAMVSLTSSFLVLVPVSGPEAAMVGADCPV
jgi:hypothetical protein